MIPIIKKKPGVVAHTFDPSTQEAERGTISEFEASLVDYIETSVAKTKKIKVSNHLYNMILQI